MTSQIRAHQLGGFGLAVLACCLPAVARGASLYESTVLSTPTLYQYYQMQDTSGTTAVSSAPTGAINGTYMSGANPDAQPPNASGPKLAQTGAAAPAFPGFGTSHDAVTFNGLSNSGPSTTGDSVLASALSVGTTYSIEAWIDNTRPVTSSLITGYVAGLGTSGSAFDAFGIMGSLDTNAGHLFLVAAGQPTLVEGPTALATNTWYDVVLMRSGNTVSLYLNGALQVSQTYTPGFTAPATQLTIGERSDNDWGFQGNISDVSVYTSALSLAEIHAHYQAALTAVPEPSSWVLMFFGLAGAWRLARSHKRMAARS